MGPKTLTFTFEKDAAEINYVFVVYYTDPGNARISSYINGNWSQTSDRKAALSGNTLTITLGSEWHAGADSYFIYG